MRQAILAALLISACSVPTVDVSSDETAQASIKRVRESLPEADRAKFDDALRETVLASLDLESVMASAFAGGEMPDPSAMSAQAADRIQGKTAREIIRLGDSIRADREAKERAAAMVKISELQERKAEADAAAAELAKFEVQRSRFWKERDYFGYLEPRIRLTVWNGTDHPISRAYFRGTLQSPGRSVPWLREEFNYSIRGGLEPGETATWTLAPNQYSEWGTTDVPTGAVFTVEVMKLDGPGQEELFSTFGFTEDDAEQLAELQLRFGSR